MRHFIAVGPNGWGKGNTEAEAVRNMKKAVPHWQGTTYRYETFEVDPDTYVGDLGDLNWPKGHPPISLGVTNPKTKQKSQTSGYVDAIRRTSEKTLGPNPDACGTQGGIAGYAALLAPKTLTPSLDFRGPSKQKSKPKVRVTEAEHTRILNLAAQMQKRGPVAPVLTGDEAKLKAAAVALKRIRTMGYGSTVENATDTILAIIRVAEAAIRTVAGL